MVMRGNKTAEIVARSIVRDALDRGLGDGDRLPPEASMIATYEVSRGSLREALRILEVQGFVSIKPGPKGGPIIRALDARDFGRMASFHFQVTGTKFQEVLEARTIVEPFLARLAATRRDKAGDERLLAVIRQTEELISDNDAAGMLHIFEDFHTTIAGMTGNRILDLYGRSLTEIFTEAVHTTHRPPEDWGMIADEHEQVARAIIEGDADRAQFLMGKHMQSFVESFAGRHEGMLERTVTW